MKITSKFENFLSKINNNNLREFGVVVVADAEYIYFEEIQDVISSNLFS